MSDVVAKCDNEKITKVKVASAEIIVSGKADKPYYEIKYYDLSKNEWCIGYGSYELKFVFQWLNECFELAKEPQGDIPVQCIDGSCPMALAEEYAECGMDVVHSCDECQYKPAKEPQECKWIHEYKLYGDEEVKKMEKETLFERIVIWVLKKLRFIETREVSKHEMCKRAQSVCSHNCNSCAWNE